MNPVTKLFKTKQIADKLDKDLSGMNKSNWKTNTIGAIVLLLTLASIWAPPQYQDSIRKTEAALVGVGLVAAKDFNN